MRLSFQFFLQFQLVNVPENKTFLDHLNSNELVHLDSMSRYMYRLFLLMTQMFNFKMNLRLTHLYAPKDSDGKWHGAVGALNRSEVDFCVTGLKWANGRYGVYEQTTAAYYAQYDFADYRKVWYAEVEFNFFSDFCSYSGIQGPLIR